MRRRREDRNSVKGKGGKRKGKRKMKGREREKGGTKKRG